MKECTTISPNIQEWSDYLKSQMDSWPEWKKNTSSYSYMPLTLGKREEDSVSGKSFSPIYGV